MFEFISYWAIHANFGTSERFEAIQVQLDYTMHTRTDGEPWITNPGRGTAARLSWPLTSFVG